MAETAREIDFPAMDTGSPSPILVWGDAAYLLYYGPANADSEVVIVVKFEGALAALTGPPSDESLMNHRLWGKGLRFYSVHVVDESEWLRDLVRRDSHRTSPGWVLSHTHYLFTFHDQTIECLARGHRWQERHTSMSEALAEVTGSVGG